jgi:hypothetical protein
MLRFRFQFGLRSLLLFVTLCSIACSVLAVTLQKAREQRRAAEEVLRRGGFVYCDYLVKAGGAADATPPAPAWLRAILGDDLFINVTQVGLNNQNFTDDDISLIAAFPHVDSLSLMNSRITDAGFAKLPVCSELTFLAIGDTGITDRSMASVASLKKLQTLDIRGIPITDDDLELVDGLDDLKELILQRTRVTFAGIERHIGKLRSLEYLWIGGTLLTASDVTMLKRELPNCTINAD